MFEGSETDKILIVLTGDSNMTLIYILYPVAIVLVSFIWLSQLGDVMIRDQRYFESHTHKLIWFLVILFGNVVGAIWYFLWKRQLHKQKSPNQRLHSIADSAAQSDA
jgi:hypothetical protein